MVAFSKAPPPPDSDFLPKRLEASEIDKSIRIWLKFTTFMCADVNTCMYQKLLEFMTDYPRKQRVAIIGPRR